MRPLLTFVKSTLVGGLLFLLPIGIILVVLGKLFAWARHAGDVLHARLFPGTQSDALPLLFAGLFLLVLAFLAGVIARSRLGTGMFTWLEARILGRFPAYTVIRQTLVDMTGGSLRLAAGEETRVVLVAFDDATQFGFLMERRPDGICVVFLPDAPSALSGSVVMVTADRLTDTDLAPAAVVQGMRRLGAGLAAVAADRPPPPPNRRPA